MSKNTTTKTLADARTLWLAAPHPKREGASNASRQANDLKNHDRALACLAAAAGDGEEALGKLPITLLQRDPNLLGRQVREGVRILAVRQDKTVASDKTLSNQVSCVRAVQKTVYQDLPQRRSVHDVIATRPSQRKNRPAFSSRDWPESLSTDWAGFKVWKMAGILPLAEQPYRKQPSRESSFKSYLCKLNQYVGFLVREQGRTDLRLEDLCDADTYTASMTVSDGQGHVVSDEIEVTVDAAPATAPPSPPDTPEVDEPPVITLLAEPTTGAAPVTTNFTARAADPEGEALTYTWTFAPGVTRGGEAIESYTYRTAGTFEAKVTVSDGSHEVESRPVAVTVGTPGGPVPVDSSSIFHCSTS